MNTDRKEARRRRAARLLVAACGAIGCTNGPAISSVSADPPAALGRSEQRALAAGDTAGRARVTEWPGLATRPIWVTGHHQPAADAPVYPLRDAASGSAAMQGPRAAARTTSRSPAATPSQEAITASVPRPTAAGVRRVSHTAVEPECASPAPGVAVVSDQRLPPAAPLGSRRPLARPAAQISSSTLEDAQRDGAVAEEAVQDATPVAERLSAKPVASSKTVPLDTFLVDGDRTRGIGTGRLQNEDMIVDSALLPRRAELRSGAGLEADVDRADYPITPRRPFATPAWQSAAATPTSSANLPVSLSPEEPMDTEPVSVAATMPAPTQVSFGSVPAVTKSTAADPEVENPFLAPEAPAAEPIETTPELQKPVLAAGPLFAPGPALAAPGGGPATAAAAIVSAAPAKLAEQGVAARPVDLTAANRLDLEGEVRRPLRFSTPLAVGLALAAVAVGAVMIRRRFA